MATFSVVPLKDGVDMRSNWAVKKNGSRISSHTKKSAALRKARSKASAGDRVVVHRTDGSIMGDAPTSRRRSQQRRSKPAVDGIGGLALDKGQEDKSLADLDLSPGDVGLDVDEPELGVDDFDLKL